MTTGARKKVVLSPRGIKVTFNIKGGELGGKIGTRGIYNMKRKVTVGRKGYHKN